MGTKPFTLLTILLMIIFLLLILNSLLPILALYVAAVFQMYVVLFYLLL